MRATSVIIALSASVVSAGVLPRTDIAIVPVDDGETHVGAITHVYVCTNAPWITCANLASTTGACYDLIPDNTLSSIGPDAGTTCTIYDNKGCSGSSLSVNYPGIGDLNSVGWNDRASSYRCN